MPVRCISSIITAATVCLVSINCGQGPEPADQPAAAHDANADRAAVEQAVRTHWQAINNGDSGTVIAQHTSDVSILMTEIPGRLTVPSPTADSLFPILLASKPRYVIEDLQVQLLGDAAVASFFMGGDTVLPDVRPTLGGGG